MIQWSRIRRAFRLGRSLVNAIKQLPDVPVVGDLDDFLRPFHASVLGWSGACTLDIGCGGKPRNPFKAARVFGIDIREDLQRDVRYADLVVEPIPYPDATFDYITAYDFVEHVPRVAYLPERRFPFVELMNEIWRTLKEGGLFLSHTPIFPYSPAFRDPTHVNILTHETFRLYFDDKNRWASMYGFRGHFEVVDEALNPPHLVSVLRKVRL